MQLRGEALPRYRPRVFQTCRACGVRAQQRVMGAAWHDVHHVFICMSGPG